MIPSIPHSIDAERGLIGSVMQDARILAAAVRLGITDSAFFHAPHATIWRVMTALDDSGKPIEFFTLTQHLSDAGQLANVGGPAVISEFGTFAVASNWKQYAATITEKARRRHLIASAQQLIAIAQDDSAAAATMEEIAQQIGLDSARSCVSDSTVQHIKVPLLAFLDQVEKAQMGNDDRVRLNFGMPRFETLTHGLPPGTMMTLGAQTSVGKTAFALQCAWNVASGTALPVLFISLEMTAEKLAGRVAASTSGVALGRLYSPKPDLSEYDFQKIHGAVLKVGLSELYLWTPQQTPTAAQVAAMIRMQKIQRPNLALVVVDYLQLLAPANLRDSRERQVAEMSGTLTRAAVGLNVTILALSQLNDDNKLRESRAIGHDSRVVARLTRPDADEDTGERTLHLDKNSEGRSAISIQMHFDGSTQRFHEKAEK